MKPEFKKTFAVALVLVALAGCKDHSADKFLGHWLPIDKDDGDFIDVKSDGDTVHFDHSYRLVALGPKAYEVERFEGKPVSEDTLRVGEGMPSYDVRLEKGTLYFRGSGYTKSE